MKKSMLKILCIAIVCVAVIMLCLNLKMNLQNQKQKQIQSLQKQAIAELAEMKKHRPCENMNGEKKEKEKTEKNLFNNIKN